GGCRGQRRSEQRGGNQRCIPMKSSWHFDLPLGLCPGGILREPLHVVSAWSRSQQTSVVPATCVREPCAACFDAIRVRSGAATERPPSSGVKTTRLTQPCPAAGQQT